MVVVEEEQLTPSTGGEKEEGWVENDIALWEESCLAKFCEFLGFLTDGFKEEILEFMTKINFSETKRQR